MDIVKNTVLFIAFEEAFSAALEEDSGLFGKLETSTDAGIFLAGQLSHELLYYYKGVFITYFKNGKCARRRNYQLQKFTWEILFQIFGTTVLNKSIASIFTNLGVISAVNGVDYLFKFNDNV